MSLESLKTESEWLEILKETYEETGMVASLTEPDGKIIKSVGDRPPLCLAIRERPETLKFVCSQTASAMMGELRVTKQPVVDVCEGGLWRMIIPVLEGGEIVGQVSVCGLAVDGEQPDTFLLSRQLERAESEVEPLLNGLKYAPDATVERMAERLMQRING